MALKWKIVEAQNDKEPKCDTENGSEVINGAIESGNSSESEDKETGDGEMPRKLYVCCVDGCNNMSQKSRVRKIIF